MALTAKQHLSWASPPFASFFAERGLRRLNGCLTFAGGMPRAGAAQLEDAARTSLGRY